MPHFSNISWTSILSNDDGLYVIAIIAFILAVLLFGFVELLLYRTTRPGLTTWAFASPGFIGVIVIIAFDSGFHPLFRILLITLWCVIIVGMFLFAYNFAQTRRKGKTD